MFKPTRKFIPTIITITALSILLLTQSNRAKSTDFHGSSQNAALAEVTPEITPEVTPEPTPISASLSFVTSEGGDIPESVGSYNVQLVLHVSDVITGPVSVTISYTGTATYDLDYSAPLTATFNGGNDLNPGSYYEDVVLTIHDDGLTEETEIVSVSLENPSSGVQVSGITTHHFSLIDNNPDCPATTLANDINTANTNNQPDVIELAQNCTYVLSETLIITNDDGNPLTINGNGASLDGNNSVRVLMISSGANLTLNDLTIQNSYFTGAREGGAAIYNAGTLTVTNGYFLNNVAENSAAGAIFNAAYATVSVANSVFEDNQATSSDNGYGAAISSGAIVSSWSSADVYGGHVTVTDSSFIDNYAERDGGAIYVGMQSTLDVSGSTFTGNHAGTASSGGLGGAIHNRGAFLTVSTSSFIANAGNTAGAIYSTGLNSTSAIEDSIFRENNATQSGAVQLGDGTGTILDTDISWNTSTSSAAGVFLANGLYVVERSTISNNVSNPGGYGAGMVVSKGTATIVNSTIANNMNHALDYYGAGVTIMNSTVVNIRHSTITGNVRVDGTYQDRGAGIYGNATLYSTIVAGNTASSQPSDIKGTMTSQGYNLIGDTHYLTLASPNVTDQLNVDPLVGSVSNNGGPVPSVPLLRGSPAMNAGGTTCPATDQRGFVRPVDDYCDIGAYEVQYGELSPIGLLEFASPGNQLISEDDGTHTIQLKLTVTGGPPHLEGEIYAELVYTGNAENGTDFSGQTLISFDNPVGLRADTYSALVDLSVLDDDLLEGTETIILTLANPSSTISLGTQTVYTVSIGDNEEQIVGIGCPNGVGDGEALTNAIQAANTDEIPNIITLEAGCSYTPTTALQLTAPESVTVNGNGATILIRPNGTTLNRRGFRVYPGAQLTLNNVILSNGYIANDHGAGIYNEGTVTINDSLITANATGNLYNGGGIYNSGTLTIRRSTLSHNTGGLTAGTGGAIYNIGSTNILNSLLSNNRALDAGAIYNARTLNIDTSTIANNTALRYTGAVYNAGQSLAVITQSTISGNLAAGNNAIYVTGGGTAVLRVGRSIVAGNVSGDIVGQFTSLGYNLFGLAGGVSKTGGTPDDITGPAPLLGNLQDNGGPTWTMHPLPDSPAIDAIDCLNATDQRGQLRPVDFAGVANAIGSTGCDIGAVEVQILPPKAVPENYVLDFNTTLTVPAPGLLGNDIEADTVSLVTSTAHGTVLLNPDGSFTYTPNDGFSGDDFFVYAAQRIGQPQSTTTVYISVAPVCLGDVGALVSQIETSNQQRNETFTIELDAGCTYILTEDRDGGYESGLPPILGRLTINGNGATLMRSTVPGTPNFRILNVSSIYPVALNNLTITNGRTKYRGGGIGCNACKLSLSGVTVYNNHTIANSGTYQEGGGIYSTSSLMTIDNSTITGNSSVSEGGGIFINGSLVITNSTISGNYAQKGGHGIWRYSGTLSIGNSIVIQNATGYDIRGPFTSLGHNLLGSTSHTISGDTSTNIQNVNPLLGVLADNGGLTPTLALLPGSPAIDAGNCVGSDQRALPRPHDFVSYPNAINSNGCDIGAYEVQHLPPIAVDDSFNTAYRTPLNSAEVNVLLNDVEADARPLIAALISGPAHGDLLFNIDGSFTYTPDLNFSAATDTFTYSASNGLEDSNVATVTIVVGANPPPVVENDDYETPYATMLTVSLAEGVLSNDADPHDPMTAVLVALPQHGSLSLNPDGSFSYTPNRGFSSSVDSFTYVVHDGTSNSTAATVTIQVGPNTPPVAEDDAYETSNSTLLIVPVAQGLLSNDDDANADPLHTTLVSPPAHGALTLEANGAFRYEPVTPFKGIDQFTYMVSDTIDNSNVATVRIRVRNGVPIAQDDVYSTAANTRIDMAAPGVMFNDTDGNLDPLTATLLTSASSGTLAFYGNGGFTYMPVSGFRGTDRFTYAVTDGEDTSQPATVVIRIGNYIPVAGNDFYTMTRGTTLVIPVGSGVLRNDTDAEQDPLTAMLISMPLHGSFTLEDYGSFTYTPASSFTGQDQFTYAASDGFDQSNVATVVIRVDPSPPNPGTNHPPVAVYDEYVIGESQSWLITIPAENGVLKNDGDPDGDPLTAILYGSWDASVTLHPDGGFTINSITSTVPPEQLGEITFHYQASDGKTNSALTAVTIRREGSSEPFDPLAPRDLQISGLPTTPTYSWSHYLSPTDTLVPDDWYRIVVIGDTVPVDHWDFFLNICEGTRCSVTLNTELAEGTYSWYVESFNQPTRTFRRSKTATFMVDTDGIPSPDLITRTAPIRGENFTDGQVKFQWLADSHALWYRMVIVSPNGFVFDQWYEGSKVCENGVCSVIRPLPSGVYDWYMVAWGPGGMGTWGGPTSGINFTVGAAKPDVPVPVNPADGETLDIPDGGVNLQWQSDPNAAYYRLYIGGPDGYVYDQWHDAVEVCTGATCSVTIYLSNGAYVWYMVGWSSEGMGSWNSGATFAINTPKPGIIQRIAPEGQALTPTVAFQWQADPHAGWYRIFALNNNDGYIYDRWVSATDTCASSLCRFTDGIIPNGSYSWWIGAWSPGGMSDWDLDPMHFSLNIPAPGIITPTAPASGNHVPAGTVTLGWQADANALWYHVRLESTAGYSYDNWLYGHDRCFGGMCSIPFNLTAGSYTWTLQAWGPGGMGNMSTANFIVNAP